MGHSFAIDPVLYEAIGRTAGKKKEKEKKVEQNMPRQIEIRWVEYSEKNKPPEY